MPGAEALARLAIDKMPILAMAMHDTIDSIVSFLDGIGIAVLDAGVMPNEPLLA